MAFIVYKAPTKYDQGLLPFELLRTWRARCSTEIVIGAGASKVPLWCLHAPRESG